MIQLPFNKWTLQFHFKSVEEKYELKQKELRLFCFRIFSISFTLICFLSLIVAIAQQQSEAQILVRSGLVLLCIALVLMNKLLQKIITSAFAFCFIVSIVGTTYISLNAFLIPQFMYGFNTSSLAIFLLQHIDNRLKIPILFILPFIQLYCFSLFNLNNIQYIPFTITSAIMFGVVSYIHEYYQKLTFSLNDIVINQREIIHEYSDCALLTVSLSERTNQFSLEFYNKKSEEQYNISNSDQMKVYFRTSFLKDQSKNQVNLEQYLYSLLEGKKENSKIQSIELQSVKEGVILQQKACIQEFYYGKPVLLIRLQTLIDKYDEQINNLHTSTIIQFQQTANSLQQLLRDIKIINSNKTTSLDVLYYHSLSIMNQVKNQLVYLHQDIIKTLKQDFKIIPLYNFMQALTPFFTCLSSQQNQEFEILNLIRKSVILKINAQLLTQILINLFEFCLSQSLKQSRMGLRLTTESNLNPLSEREIKTTNNFSKVPKNEQQLIKFQFSYYSDQGINIQQHCPSNQYSIINITKLLVAFIGPYNDIQTNSSQEYQIYLNRISFYIYSDQSQLETSYTKCIKR